MSAHKKMWEELKEGWYVKNQDDYPPNTRDTISEIIDYLERKHLRAEIVPVKIAVEVRQLNRIINKIDEMIIGMNVWPGDIVKMLEELKHNTKEVT